MGNSCTDWKLTHSNVRLAIHFQSSRHEPTNPRRSSLTDLDVAVKRVLWQSDTGVTRAQ